jgi:hypothetical protein
MTWGVARWGSLAKHDFHLVKRRFIKRCRNEIFAGAIFVLRYGFRVSLRKRLPWALVMEIGCHHVPTRFASPDLEHTRQRLVRFGTG